MDTLKKAFLPVRVFSKIAIKRAFRDKTALFFIFLFPLIFLFVFGGIFGKNNDTSFRVALINQSDTDFAKQLVKDSAGNKILKVDKEATTFDTANEKMKRGQLDATVVLPPEFGQQAKDQNNPSGEAVVYYTQNSQQAAQTLAAYLQGQVFAPINAKFVKTETPFSVKTVQTNDKALSQFDYTFAGLLGFSIIGMGIFGPVNVFPELKKQGVLRRLHTTPLKVWQYFLANVVSQAVIGMMSIAIMFAVAITVFHLKVTGNILELALYIILGITLILGIGLSIGGWARNERQAAPLANLVVFPMMFLSGTFFPRFLMPHWLQTASSFLPLTPVIDGVRLIATEGKGFLELGPQLGMIGCWLVVIYAIAFTVFRWE